MPTIVKGDKILVSGSNGYIPMWITRILLERGYKVRGTVRGTRKGVFLENYFAYLGLGDKFEFFVAGDITKEGAFDEAVKDVDAIIHAASPFHVNAKTPEEFYDPAIQGTVGILQSALKNGQKVKRIVVTSSCAAIMSPPSKPTVFSELDWNDHSQKEVEEKGSSASPMVMYLASKTLAEKSAWSFYEKHKSEIQWDLAVINPPFVFGPHIHDALSSRALNTSLATWWQMVIDDAPKTKEALLESNSWVDVRDCALAHVLALEKEAAGGERIIVCSGKNVWQEWIDVANALSPNPFPRHILPKGLPEIIADKPIPLISYDTAKEKKLFGIQFRTQAQTTKDTLEDFAKRRW